MSLPEISQDLNLYKLFLACLGLVVTVFAFRMVISFDYNKWAERREQKNREKMQILCPHADYRIANGKVEIRSLMTSPSGTLAWICTRCHVSTNDPHLAEDIVNEFLNDPKLLLNKTKKFNKHLKKFYRL